MNRILKSTYLAVMVLALSCLSVYQVNEILARLLEETGNTDAVQGLWLIGLPPFLVVALFAVVAVVILAKDFVLNMATARGVNIIVMCAAGGLMFYAGNVLFSANLVAF